MVNSVTMWQYKRKLNSAINGFTTGKTKEQSPSMFGRFSNKQEPEASQKSQLGSSWLNRSKKGTEFDDASPAEDAPKLGTLWSRRRKSDAQGAPDKPTETPKIEEKNDAVEETKKEMPKKEMSKKEKQPKSKGIGGDWWMDGYESENDGEDDAMYETSEREMSITTKEGSKEPAAESSLAVEPKEKTSSGGDDDDGWWN